MNVLSLILSIMLSLLVSTAYAENKPSASETAEQSAMEEVKALSNDIQKLKLDVISLNKNLLSLEENLLYPSSSKYSIFVSMNSGKYFTLEGVRLKLNGKWVTTHLYDAGDRMALARGGVHKLYVTNLSEGEHTATVFFTGLGPNATPFKRATELSFKKVRGQGFLEVSINDNGSIQEPEFSIKKW